MESNNEKAIVSSAAIVASPAVPARAKVAVTFIVTSTDTQFVTLSGKIEAALTGNANFTSPLPTIATLTAARNTYVTAVNALDRGATSIAARDQSRKALGQVLRDLALYVQHTSQGDLVKLISSGYPVQRPRGAVTLDVPAPPARVKLSRGATSGQVRVRCSAVSGALLYQCRYATAQTPAVWTLSDTSSSGGMLLVGLVPITEYLVQGRAYGKRGCSDWTDSATVVAS